MQRPVDSVVVPNIKLGEVVGGVLMLDYVPEDAPGQVAVKEDLQ